MEYFIFLSFGIKWSNMFLCHETPNGCQKQWNTRFGWVVSDFVYKAQYIFHDSKTFHTVVFWTFTFHKKQAVCSRFGRQILNESENSDLIHSFFFYFLQELSNPVLFAHCFCYSKELKYLNCNLTPRIQTFWNSINSVQKSTGFDNSCKK